MSTKACYDVIKTTLLKSNYAATSLVNDCPQFGLILAINKEETLLELHHWSASLLWKCNQFTFPDQ